MSSSKAQLIFSMLSGFFLLGFDQILKFLARANPSASHYLWNPWVGWEYFPNPGIAFGIPIPYYVIIIATPIVLISILGYYHKITPTSSLRATFGIMLIITGALSNFIDRYLFSVTIDYLRIATSIINLADIMIASGAFLCFLEAQRTKLLAKK